MTLVVVRAEGAPVPRRRSRRESRGRSGSSAASNSARKADGAVIRIVHGPFGRRSNCTPSRGGMRRGRSSRRRCLARRAISEAGPRRRHSSTRRFHASRLVRTRETYFSMSLSVMSSWWRAAVAAWRCLRLKPVVPK